MSSDHQHALLNGIVVIIDVLFTAAFASGVIEAGPNPRQGKKSDQAHPPIHPTKYANNLQGNEKLVYEFVVRHFLACVSKDAQGLETIVDINIADEAVSHLGIKFSPCLSITQNEKEFMEKCI